MRKEVLRMERVGCAEHGVTELEDFNLSIFYGEIVGLLPVNQHGLAALLRLLQYNTPLRDGYVYYREEQVNTWRASKPRNNRIGLIQSGNCLVDGLTVADNIFVLKPGFRAHVVNSSLLDQELTPFLEEVGIRLTASTYVSELTDFQRVVVGVLKAVVAGCKLIVLQDISADICETELEKIHRILSYYADQGIAFLYVDYHFEELQQVCHRVALMANGRIMKIVQSDQTTPEILRSYTSSYGHKVKKQLLRSVPLDKTPIFQAEKITGDLLSGLSFHVAAGECIVLQDVDGKQFGELLAMISGEISPVKGTLSLEGLAYQPCVGSKLAIIQELPAETMLFKEMSYLDNLCFTLDHRLPELWRSKRVQIGVRRECAHLLDDRLFDLRVDTLNQFEKYTLVYHRIALQRPKVVFCVQPFRKADLELRMHIWELLKMLLDKDIAVVILAINLADTLSLADRLIRMKKESEEEVYERSQFSTIPFSAPWLDFYREQTKNQDRDR